MQLADALAAFVQANGFVCGIVASAAGEVLARSGNFGSLKWDGVPKALWGDSESIRRLYESLDGEILPQIHGQGDVTCVVNKVGDDLLVGLFDQSGRDDLELFDIGATAPQALVG